MARPRVCAEGCVDAEGKKVKMVPFGKAGNMKCPACGSIWKKPKEA